MKSLRMAMIGALCATFAHLASSEVLQGVLPLSSFGKIKKDFPNGRFERVKAAWVKEDEAFYSMTGDGFPGRLYLAFDDSRPYWRQFVKDAPPESPEASASEVESNAQFRQWAQGLANQPDDDALTISWVRWVPSTPIPMERVKGKYGEPTKCDFDPADFSPFCSWEARSLSAQTTDDRKSVVFFTARFTRGELRAAYKAKGSYVPDWLKEDVPSSPAKVPPKADGVSTRKIKPTT
jgi:hypothetical protein